MREQVYAVHATRPEEVGSVEVIFSDEQTAPTWLKFSAPARPDGSS